MRSALSGVGLGQKVLEVRLPSRLCGTICRTLRETRAIRRVTADASGGPHGAGGPSHGRVFECLKGDGVPEGKQPLQSSLHEEPTDQPSDRPERQLVLDRVFED